MAFIVLKSSSVFLIMRWLSKKIVKTCVYLCVVFFYILLNERLKKKIKKIN